MALTKDQFIAEIESMSVKDLADLVKALEEKFGVSAAAPVMMAGVGGPAAGGAAGGGEAKSSFDVILSAVPADKKIGAIKIVREVTGLGLKEAKDLVDGAPKPLKEGVSKDEADKIKEKFNDSGATITIK